MQVKSSLLAILFSGGFLFLQAQSKKETTATTTKTEVMAKGDIYSFKVKDIEGKEFDFETTFDKWIIFY